MKPGHADAKRQVFLLLLLLSASAILVWSVLPPVHSFSTGQSATAVFGQPNFNSVSQSRAEGPRGMAFDSSGNLWVADFYNSRVLRFSPPFSNGMSANLVIGQQDFVSASYATTQSALSRPDGVVFDSSGNLWVSDTYNNRILRFSPPFTNGMNANLVIGHSSFTTQNDQVTTATTLSIPSIAAFDSSGNLWVADNGNDRVLRYSPPFSTGMSANLVLGQSGFTTYANAASQSGMYFPYGIVFDSSGNLWVSDEGNNRLLHFSQPFSSGMNADTVLGQATFTTGSYSTTSTGLDDPTVMAIDSGGNLWVSDNSNYRVLQFKSPLSNGMSASLVLGQADFVTSSSIGAQAWFGRPQGVLLDSSGNLWVSDSSNAVILRFNPPFSNGAAASLAIGQGQNTLSSPRGVYVDPSGNLWVADNNNDRVVRYGPPFSSGMNATLVIGQPDFASNGFVPRQNGLESSDGITMDSAGNLWVADYYANRVLRFSPPFTNGMNANLVLGQTSFTTNVAATTQSGLSAPHSLVFDSSGNLWVSDQGNNRVLMFSPPFATGMSASLVLGQSSFVTGASSTTQSGFNYPWGLSVDSSGNLWVADDDNSRVLMFSPPFTNGESASLVLGQPGFVTSTTATTQNGFQYPEAAVFDPRGNLWVTDTSNNRVLRFSPPFSNGMNANLVIGQVDFQSSGASCSSYNLCTYAAYGTQNGFDHPRSIAFDSAGNLFVSDRYNYRVLEFTCGTECPSASLSFSYSVQGGGSGYSAPTLTYSFGGIPRTSTLSTTSTSVSIDYGSSWSVSSTLPGSTASERWATSKAVSGTATAAQTVSVTFYHQYNINLGYYVKGGGTGYTSPSVNFTQFTSQVSATAGSSAWVDAGSSYSMPAQLAGSSSTERWSAKSFSGTVTSSAAVSVAYYHQFLFTASYSVVGGGTPTAPTLSSVQFAAPATVALTTGPTGYWLDSGSSWNMTNPLQGSGSSERWFASAPSGSVSTSATVSQAYHHQFFVTVQANPTEGGSVSPRNDWHDSASSVQIAASANLGWQFTGWTGTGTGSYSGSNSSATLSVSGALTEVANFKPLATTTSSTATSTTTSSSQSTTTTSTTATSSQTSTTTTSTSASTATPTTSTASSTTPTTSSSTASTASTTGGGAIPEYPFQLLVILAFTALVILSYIAARTRGPSRDSGAIRS